MRGCHHHDHTASNRAMWARPVRKPVQVPNPAFDPLARKTVNEQGVGE